MRRRSCVAAVAASCLSLLATAPAAHADGSGRDEVRLRVMTFNVFYGGDDLDLDTGDFCDPIDSCDETFRRVVATVRASRADVVGIQEPDASVGRLARALGWYADERAHLVSRFPLAQPPEADGLYAYVEVAPGRAVAVANLHLTSDPYGPYAVRDGAGPDEVLALERLTRLPEVERALPRLRRVMQAGVPLVVTGDFNSPSHLDWTPGVATVRPEVRVPLAWPASKAFADAGLRDTYREAHPDPVATPGFTWTPGGPESAPPGEEVHDRIDWVLAGGAVRTLDSRIVGERGGPDVDIAVARYPSDHRAVVSTLSVRPVSPPAYVAVANRRAFVGERVSIGIHGSGAPGEVAEVTGPGGAVRVVELRRRTDLEVSLRTGRLAPGRYDVTLWTGSGRAVSSASFWLYPPGTAASVATTSEAYAVGEPIGVRWAAAAGRGLDWVAVYRCDTDGCAPPGDYLRYVYTGATIEGSGAIGDDSREGAEPWPLAAGTYVVRLLADDGYRVMAESAPFVVGAPGS